MSAVREFITRYARADEMTQVGAFVARTFSRGEPHRYNLLYHRSGENLLNKPGFDSSMCRIGLIDGQIVAHARIEPYTLRYGNAFLRVAGITHVCTHPNHRNRGYSAAIMRDALAYMAEQGAHLALLDSTVADYYTRFGFSAVWPDYYLEVESAEAAALEPRLRLREIWPDDIPQMAALYERHWGGKVTMIRTPEDWMWRTADTSRTIEVVSDRQGRVYGYISGFGTPGDKVEVVADSLDAAVTLLAEAGRRCQESGISHIQWLMPPDDTFTNFARQVVTVTLSARYRLSSGWLARLIDTSALVEALLDEIIAQGRTTLTTLTPRDLVFDCQPDRVEIVLRGQKTSFCQLNHQDFIQVMFGSLRPAALAQRPHMRLHPDAVRLLEALFPPRMASLAPWDWF